MSNKIFSNQMEIAEKNCHTHASPKRQMKTNKQKMNRDNAVTQHTSANLRPKLDGCKWFLAEIKQIHFFRNDSNQ